MNGLSDLSIGQRLWLACGGLLLILIAAGASILHAQNAADAAQQVWAQQIRPLREAAQALETALLYADSAARTVVVDPDAEQRDRFSERVEAVRATLDRFDALRMDAESQAQLTEFRPLVESFLREAGEFSNRAHSSDASIQRQEGTASSVREQALTAVREFAQVQRERADRALAELDATRAQVSQTFLGAGLLAMLSFLAFAWLTARAIRGPVVELLDAAGDLRHGRWQRALSLRAEDADDSAPAPRNEMAQLGLAFGAAAWSLEKRERRLQADGRIAAASATTLDKHRLGENVLRAVLEHSRGQLGIVYGLDESGETLVPVASQAASAPEPLPVGAGLPGQAARERRIVVVDDIPADTRFAIDFGFNEAMPRAIAALPVVAHDQLLAVIVVASLRRFDDSLLSFFESAARQLATGLRNALAYERIQALLADLRERNQEIQAQNEELQAQNEEIQAQNEEIQAQAEELRAQQNEIRDSNDRLREHAERLEAQKASLEEYSAQLRQQRELLADADRRKNEFLGLLAHELRNPLAPITSSLFILGRAAPGSESARQAIDVIGRQANHLTRLVEDLLDITRISEGKIRIQCERIDLLEVVTSCVEDSRLAVQAAELSLEVDMPEGAIWIDADRVRIAQVIGNLIGNAIKFTEPGGRIGLCVEADAARSEVEIRVADSGIGIEPELLPNLFHPFMQGKLAGPRPNGGLGLGLSLVKSLAELHGGSVEARSEGRGRGAEFVLRLPVQAIEAPAGEDAASTSGAAGEGPLRVLIIDDNVDAGVMLAHALRLHGHVVEVCTSSAEGLAWAQRERPEVVLCDIGLPGMDGHEIARRLRADKRLDRSFLVAITGYASAEDRAAASAAGFDEHIAKPVTLERLHEVLSQIPRRSGRKLLNFGGDDGARRQRD